MSSRHDRPRANYVTNLPLSSVSGGWSGFNAAICENLSPFFDLHYVGPVSPREDWLAKAQSKFRRVLGGRGSFHFFSPRRLEAIRREVERRSSPDAAYNFFHGATPWIGVRPSAPYACYLDVCFATYLEIYHDERQFKESDIRRLFDAEKAWLERARRVFFSSEWALEQTVERYGLRRDHLRVVNLGGYIDVPSADHYTGDPIFLFVALDFERKGGRTCSEAFRLVRRHWPSARLRIVGEQPPADVLAVPGVEYVGRLRKNIAHERQLLQEAFATALALVHPTTMDATPQVIIEAAYHGCPTIAPRSFAIPELIGDGVTGFLVAAPPNAEELSDRMLRLRDPDVRRAMRRAARDTALRRFRWQRVGELMATEMLGSAETGDVTRAAGMLVE